MTEAKHGQNAERKEEMSLRFWSVRSEENPCLQKVLQGYLVRFLVALAFTNILMCENPKAKDAKSLTVQ